MRVMNKALKIIIAHLNHVGLNIPIKLNETLIDSCMVFFRLLGSSKASYCKITFGRRRLRQERETRLATT